MREVLARAVSRFGLGPSLRLLRTEREWSLKDLAAHSNLSVSQISSLERGANLPSLESLLAIARAFERKPSEILAAIDF
jgi:transcriptional regulator with XRE-family HTH domain